MADNPFDQFDQGDGAGNPFDQFESSDDNRQMPPAKDKIDPLSAMRHTIPQPESQPFAKTEKTGLPMVWSVRLGRGEYGPTVRAVRDDKAGGYVFQDERDPTKWNLVVRRADGSLTSKPIGLYSPTEDMSVGQLAAAGAGKAMMDTGRGVGQIVSKIGNLAGLVSDADMQAKYQQEADIRQQDRALMDTGAGKAGYVGGQLVTMIAPGAVAKTAGAAVKAAGLTRTATALNATGNALIAPKTYLGAGALGAASGPVQPVTSEGERLANTVIGGAAGAAVPAALNATARGVATVTPDAVKNTARIAGGIVGSAVDAIPGRSAVVATTPATATAANGITMAEAQNLAKDASKKMGFNWDGLDDSMKATMSAQVYDAVNLDTGIPPEGIAKKVMLEKLGFKPTRAMLTGNMEDFRIENSARMYPEGADLNAVDVANNANLRKQIQSAMPVDAIEVAEYGQQLRKGLGKEAAVSEGRVNSLYNVAAQNEGAITTDATKLIDALRNKQSFAVSKQDSPVREYLRAIGKDDVFFPTANTVSAKNAPKELTMSELATLRQIVNSRWENVDNATQASLDRLRGILNTMEANPNAPAPLYQKARVSRIIQGKKWESPELNDIFAQDPTFKGRMQVADEELFRHVFVRPTVEKTSTVWQRMNSAQKDATRAQMAKYIEDATFSNMGMTGGVVRDTVGSPAKFISALNSIGPKKLDMIMGRQQSQRLRDLASAWKEIQASPAGTKAAGSAPEIAMMQRRIMQALGGIKALVPFGKGAIEGVAETVEKGAKEAALRKQREAAVKGALSPLEAAKEAKAVADELARREAKRKGALAIPAAATSALLYER